jgi:hypothetical protein
MLLNYKYIQQLTSNVHLKIFCDEIITEEWIYLGGNDYECEHIPEHEEDNPEYSVEIDFNEFKQVGSPYELTETKPIGCDGVVREIF